MLRDAPDAPIPLPEPANPMFLSHGNLALSLGIGGGASGVPRGSIRTIHSQANSASNLNFGYPNQPNPNSIYNTYNSSPFASNQDPRGPNGGGLSSSLLQTFAVERGDDSGIDEDEGQSPEPDINTSRNGSTSGGGSRMGNNKSPSGGTGVPMIPGLSNSQPRLAFNTQPSVDATRATLLKEELKKHMCKFNDLYLSIVESKSKSQTRLK